MSTRGTTTPGTEQRGPASPAAPPAPTLSIADLSITYHTDAGDLPAVRHVSLDIHAGEAMGLVGESGSGKTTLALGAIAYLPDNGRIEAGTSRLHGIDLVSLPQRQMRGLWGSKIGLVSQDPQTALNPTLTIGRQLDEMGKHHLGLGASAARQASLAMLGQVDMPDPLTVAERYPHQLSGGMLQRCAIAMALLTHPDLLILDEPTTALDVTTQALILDLLADLRATFEVAVLYITHNLGVVSRFCDRVAVMYAGEILEQAPVAELFSRSLHPYTANLLNCMPRLGASRCLRPEAALPGSRRPATGPPRGAGPGSRRLATLPGVLPPLVGLPRGCIFEARCPLARENCSDVRPLLAEAEPGHFTACLHWQTLTSDEGRAAAVHTVDAAAAHLAPPRPILPDTELLEVTGLVKDFPGPRRGTKVRAVDGTSLAFDRGQTFGLVGESGSGKTTVARAIAGLTPPTSGRVVLEGVELRPAVNKRDREILRRLQMVFQNPESSLNPRHTVRQQLLRPLMRLGGLNRSAAAERATALLQAVRLPPVYLDRYAGELSGGEKQRVAIARAFATDPDLVICDEPVSSLDVSVQGALMNLLLDLQDEKGTSYLFISHDIAAVEHLSHVIGVMYLGRLVEQGEANLVLSPPYHPYTEALLSAVPDPDTAARVPRVRLRGARPAGSERVEGCPFHPRCPRYLGEICRTVDPAWQVPPDRSGPEQEPAAPVTRGPETVPHAIRCHIPYEELGALQEGDAALPEAPPEASQEHGS